MSEEMKEAGIPVTLVHPGPGGKALFKGSFLFVP